MFVQTPTRAVSCPMKRSVAEMLKGGVIIEVANVEQARLAEDAGAVALVASYLVRANIFDQGGMADPDMINQIISAVSIPVMGRSRHGRYSDAQLLQSLGVDYIYEADAVPPEDHSRHIDKRNFTVPFVCGASTLAEAMHHINEGAAMLRSMGKAGTSNASNASDNIRKIRSDIAALSSLRENDLYVAAKQLQVPHQLVKEVAETGDFPVPIFTAGGVAMPAEAAAMRQLGADGLFIGPGIFQSRNPAERAAALANAFTFFDEPTVIAKISRDLALTRCE